MVADSSSWESHVGTQNNPSGRRAMKHAEQELTNAGCSARFVSNHLASMVAGLFVFFMIIVRLIYFYHAQDSVLISVMPDDAFYYIQMAKHRAINGFWTFDGTSPATGFHFLYGYFLFFIYSVFGEILWRQLYLIVGVLSSVFIGLAAYLVSRSAASLFGRKSILFSIIPFIGPAALISSTAMMESWLVLFFSAATIYLLAIDNKPSIADGVTLLILGVLGSLSRTDFGMLPGVMFSVYLISHPFLKSNRLKRSALVLVGAVIGVAIVLIQNLYISGQLFQASAQTKFYWSSVTGHDVYAPLYLAKQIAVPFYGSFSKIAKVIALLCSVCFLVYSFRSFLKTKDRKRYLPKLVFVLGCLLTVISYVLFYRHNSQDLQIWYSSNFIAPVSIILAGSGILLFGRQLLVPGVAIFCSCAVFGAVHLFELRWPDQAEMMQAGLFLKASKSDATYASFNAGIISYFSGLDVINIDGLANDGILPFIKNNSLFDYIKSRNINYLIDYEVMLNEKRFRIRGGYLDDRVDKCFKPLHTVVGDSQNWRGRLRIFEIVHDCT
jgi:hypothetical protein